MTDQTRRMLWYAHYNCPAAARRFGIPDEVVEKMIAGIKAGGPGEVSGT